MDERTLCEPEIEVLRTLGLVFATQLSAVSSWSLVVIGLGHSGRGGTTQGRTASPPLGLPKENAAAGIAE